MASLQTTIRQFRNYKGLAERALDQLNDESLLRASDAADNSLVVLVKHMHGNMLSRWTNFLTEDGEKAWRQRDEEFEHSEMTRAQLLELWNAGWSRMFETLEQLSEADLERTIQIRGEAMTAGDAIIRQTMHYAYHVGQIVQLCKQRAGDGWQSLSIPKGGSAAYNSAMQEHPIAKG